MNRTARLFIAAGALVLALGVALGAVASHAAGRAPHPDAARLLQIAVLYQLVHGIALVLVGVLARFAIGLACFCGSLYWLAFTGVSAGPIAPIGGSAFIAGWVLLGIHAVTAERA